ncbi:MAG TPA: hypothetical protein VK508_20150 [Cyclobacteriaceae bacterium]|nr:hypothetical protein [Cyclobacteriaceae bacterium]
MSLLDLRRLRVAAHASAEVAARGRTLAPKRLSVGAQSEVRASPEASGTA